MNESGFWAQIRKNMKGRWNASRHENMAQCGTPDVSYGIVGKNGWIELKYKKEWPKRPTTPLRMKHFTAAQKNWLQERGRYGGNCWMFLRIGKEYLLFEYGDVQNIGELTRSETYEAASYIWINKMDWADLVRILKEGC